MSTMINHDQFDELICSLNGISKAISHLDKTLFDTLGSGESGDALKAIVSISETLEERS